MKWKKLIDKYAATNRLIKPQPPASEKQIEDVEKYFGVMLPDDLKEMLRECNGDGDLIWSTELIIENNEMMRAQDWCMPFDGLLLFAGNGCGDYFGYPISREGIKGWHVYIWEHEEDNRIWIAGGLEDLITRLYSDGDILYWTRSRKA